MTSVMKCLNRRYSDLGDGDQCGFLFMSCSPESKRGLLPNIISLNGYNIEVMGHRIEDNDATHNESDNSPTSDYSSLSLKHIASLDLTDNLLSDWNEVFNILKVKSRIENQFKYLSENILSKQRIDLQ